MKMRQKKIGLLGQLAVAAVWRYLSRCVWHYLAMCGTTCVCVAPPRTLVPNPTDDYF